MVLYHLSNLGWHTYALQGEWEFGWLARVSLLFVLLHEFYRAPLLADLFLYSYESEFLDNMIRGGHRKLARSFNLCYRYIDDLIVFNNKKFGDYVKEIYPSQLTVEKAC